MAAYGDSISQLFYTGEYGRILDESRRLQPNIKEQPARTALMAQAMFEAGDLPRAREWARGCAESSHEMARARGQLVLAMHVRATGDMAQATPLFQSALRRAEEAHDPELEAWIAVSLLRHMFYAGGLELAAAMLPTTRARAARAGSAQATAYLHATVAVAEGLAARPKEARRHLQIADDLLASRPHAWLRCFILSIRAATALAEREFDEANGCLQKLRELTRQHGLISDYARAGVNLGNLAFFTGQFRAAEEALLEAMKSPHTARVAKLSAAETLAQLRLSQGRLDDCADILRNIERTSAEISLSSAFPVQWARLTEARLLLRRHEPRAGLRN